MPLDVPYLSVIIPIHDVAPYLSDCLESILHQKFSAWECICVDDGSTDGSAEILDKFSKQDSRFRVIHQFRRGVSASRNLAIELARGKYLAFVDGDDVLSDEWFSNAVHIAMDTGADLIRARYVLWEDGHTLPTSSHRRDFSCIKSEELFTWGWCSFLQSGQVWLYFVRRNVLQGLRFPENLAVREDVVFSLSLLPQLTKVFQSEFDGYFYRMRSTSAWHVKRCSQDVIVFLQHIARLWDEAREHLISENEIDRVRIFYTKGILNTLTEWVNSNDQMMTSECRAVSMVVLKAIKSDGFSLKSFDLRWRIAFVWFNWTGSFAGFKWAKWWFELLLPIRRLAKLLLKGGCK